MSEKCFGQDEFGWQDCAAANQRRVRLNNQLRCDTCDSVILTRANQDALTGLPNLYALEDAYTTMVAADNLLGGIFIDLTKFKKVNDRLGHATGDRMIQIAADSIRDNDFAARIGGDEFFILLAKHTSNNVSEINEQRNAVSLNYEQRLIIATKRIAAKFVSDEEVVAYNSEVTTENKLQMRCGYSLHETWMQLKDLTEQADIKGETIESVSAIKALGNLLTRTK